MKLYVVHCLDLVRRGGSHHAAQDSLELKRDAQPKPLPQLESQVHFASRGKPKGV